MNGRNFRTASVPSWCLRAAGHDTPALSGGSRRMRSDEADGPPRTKARTVTSTAELPGTKREALAGSALGRWPNPALQRIAARWRLGTKPNGFVWAARAEGKR